MYTLVARKLSSSILSHAFHVIEQKGKLANPVVVHWQCPAIRVLFLKKCPIAPCSPKHCIFQWQYYNVWSATVRILQELFLKGDHCVHSELLCHQGLVFSLASTDCINCNSKRSHLQAAYPDQNFTVMSRLEGSGEWRHSNGGDPVGFSAPSKAVCAFEPFTMSAECQWYPVTKYAHFVCKRCSMLFIAPPLKTLNIFGRRIISYYIKYPVNLMLFFK